MKQPVAGAGVQGCGPPKLASAVKPTLGYVVAKLTSAVLIVRNEAAAEDSLADILARIKFGIAMAAMVRMTATTISSSINEKPLCSWRILRFSFWFLESCRTSLRRFVLSVLLVRRGAMVSPVLVGFPPSSVGIRIPKVDLLRGDRILECTLRS